MTSRAHPRQRSAEGFAAWLSARQRSLVEELSSYTPHMTEKQYRAFRERQGVASATNIDWLEALLATLRASC